MTKPSFIEAARREQIIGAAIEVLAEHGYADTSLARIAQATGVSNAAILYYFGSKKAVIEGAYAYVIDAVSQAVHAAMIAAPTARDSIEAYVRSLVGYMAEHPKHVRLIVETVVTPDLDAAQRDATQFDAAQLDTGQSESRPRWVPLADAITRARLDGQIRAIDARTSAIILGGAIDAIIAESLTDPEYALDAATDQIVTLFQRATDI